MCNRSFKKDLYAAFYFYFLVVLKPLWSAQLVYELYIFFCLSEIDINLSENTKFVSAQNGHSGISL